MTSKNSKTKRPSLDKLKVESEVHRPSEFMRARRPSLFSDSRVISSLQLPQAVFEYHLETLTRRKQETEFEHFARRLAEKEICPNLIPQTGPVGGGDSKVDSETYPVSDTISIRWYEGIGQEASQERWGFAFSAKKEWQPKVRSDVKKIVDTHRGYKRIFFITNQFVRDRKRAEIEDELAKEHQVSVRILDRSWIVKCVFENDRLHLAAETLSIEGFDETQRKEPGPHDVRRTTELKELEDNIADPNRYQNVEYQLVEDCLRAALLARGLELPRVNVEGMFHRAERVAEKGGNHQQKLRVVYNMAWTTYWWYEDFEEFSRLYDRVEDLVVGSIQASDLELLCNLWQPLQTAIKRGAIGTAQGKLEQRTATLKAELDRIASNDQRPNNALTARTNRVLVDLTEAMIGGKGIENVLKSLKETLKKSIGLSEYHVASISQIIQEMGDFLIDSPKYDQLLEVVVKITEQRSSEGEAGKVLLNRGRQMLEAGKSYEAIKLLGRAQQMLAKHEYHEEWVLALVGCGLSYEGVGLLWAARSNILMAASLAFSEYAQDGTLRPQSLPLVQKLVWIELQLGRVPHALSWIELASMLANLLPLDESQKEKYDNERNFQDAVLGMLLLEADISNLKWLDFLPSVLDRLDLTGSWLALLYALGYEDYLRSEGAIPQDQTQETLLEFFSKWLEQPAKKDIPEQPELLLGTKVVLHSYVLGCDVAFEVSNNPTSIYLAETILGALEAFLATSFDSQLLPYRSELKIVIEPSDFLTELPEYKIDDLTEESAINVKHPLKLSRTNETERAAFRSWLQDFIIRTVFEIAAPRDADSFANQVIKNEAGVGRALNFAEVDITTGNVLGSSPKFSLSDWQPEGAVDKYPLKRDLPWNTGLITEGSISEDKESGPLKFGEGEPPEELFGIDNLKHKDRGVISLINLPLWNKADWRATAYIYVPDKVPSMILGFGNVEAGRLIFKEWKRRLGDVDENEQLRISVITGIDRRKPASYRIVISANPNLMEKSTHTHFVLVSRLKTLEPPDTVNLDNFLVQYKKAGRYTLLPAYVESPAKITEPLWEYWIGKRELIVRPAWQIGENDPDVMAIGPDTDPVIPSDVRDAPVIKAMQRFSKRKKHRKH